MFTNNKGDVMGTSWGRQWPAGSQSSLGDTAIFRVSRGGTVLHPGNGRPQQLLGKNAGFEDPGISPNHGELPCHW